MPTGGDWSRICANLGALGTHLGPVLNDLAHVGEHAAQVGRDLLAVDGVAVAVDLEVHPGLAQDPELGSRAAPVDAGRVRAPRSRISSSSPVASRRTSISGCTTMWTVRPMRVSSAVTESTRKGMSSVTIWTTVCPLAQPCSSNSGLNTSTLALPTGRFCASCRWGQGGPEEVLGGAGEQVLGGHVPVVPPEEALEPFTPHVVGQLGGGVQQLLTRLLQRHGHAVVFILTLCDGPRRCVPHNEPSAERPAT